MFKGHVSAVFEGGLATTVIIYETLPNLIDQGSTNVTGSATYLDVMATVTAVKEALKTNNVVITGGDWTPVYDGLSRLVEIPEGRTLTIQDGSFDAQYENVAVHLKTGATNGTLVVNGVYTMTYNTSSTINYSVKAGAMRILAIDAGGTPNAYPVTITKDVVIEGNVSAVSYGLQVQNACAGSLPEVVVASKGSINVKAKGVDALKFNIPDPYGYEPVTDNRMQIDGTVTVGGSIPYIGVTMDVNSLTSLHASGATLTGNLNLNNGLAEIKKMDGGKVYSTGLNNYLIVPVAEFVVSWLFAWHRSCLLSPLAGKGQNLYVFIHLLEVRAQCALFPRKKRPLRIELLLNGGAPSCL